MKISENRTHYLRWKLDMGDGSWSIRYHFLWQSNKDAENKYILKHHNSSTYSIISTKMAELLIQEQAVKVEEIVASVHIQSKGTESKKFQNKVIIDSTHIKSVRGTKDDILLKKMKHHFFNKENALSLHN